MDVGRPQKSGARLTIAVQEVPLEKQADLVF